MTEEQKARAGIVYNVVESFILAMSIGLMVWLANVVILHGNALSSQSALIGVNTKRLDIIETHGTRSLGEHEKLDDQRVTDIGKRLEKVEQAVLVLQNTPSRLDSVQASLARIERILEEHMKDKKP